MIKMTKDSFVFYSDDSCLNIDITKQKITYLCTLAIMLLNVANATTLCDENVGNNIKAWQLTQKKVISAPEYQRLANRLDKLIKYYDSDEDLPSILQPCIDNVKAILKECINQDHLLKGWNIFVNSRGALSLENKLVKNKSAYVNIGQEQISYILDNGDLHIDNVEKFSVNAVKKILEKLI